MRVKCRFHFAQFCKKFLTKNAGLYSARKPLPCSPHNKPPYFAVSATARHEDRFIKLSGSHIQRWQGNVQDTCVDVTEHTVALAVAVEQRAKFSRSPDVPAVRRDPR